MFIVNTVRLTFGKGLESGCLHVFPLFYIAAWWVRYLNNWLYNPNVGIHYFQRMTLLNRLDKGQGAWYH